jgi:hypothetical protein
VTPTDVLTRFGGVALARLAGALVLALLLHLVRLPLLLAVRVIAVALSRVDGYVLSLPYSKGDPHVAR